MYRSRRGDAMGTKDEYVMRDNKGKVVVVRVEEEDHLKLCAIDGQGPPETSVKLLPHKANRSQKALIFHHGKTFYLTKVEKTVLMLEQTTVTDNIPESKISESHLFEMVPEGGRYFRLQTVAAPRQYITLTSGSLTLCDRNERSAKVKFDLLRQPTN